MRSLLFFPFFLVLSALGGCAPHPVPIALHSGMTVDEAILACRAAGAEVVNGPTGSGPISRYLESYALSDGRRMNLVTDHTKRPPIVIRGGVTP